MISYPAAVGGISTRVLEAGSGDAHVVFIHGTAGRADRWSRNLDAQAAAGRHAWAFDLPGHGFAQKGMGTECSVPAYRDMLGAFLDAIGAGPAVLVGTSLGGHVAAALAVAQSQRVKALVLSGSMGLAPIGPEARARIQGGANNQSLEGVAMKFSRVIHDPALVTPDMVEEEFRINNSPGARESFAQLGRYIGERLDDDVAGPALAALPIPKLLIWGAQDPVVPLAVGRAAQALLPGSRLAVIDGAAHTPYYERADAFNRVLGDFLDGNTAPIAPHGVEYF